MYSIYSSGDAVVLILSGTHGDRQGKKKFSLKWMSWNHSYWFVYEERFEMNLPTRDGDIS